MSAGQNTQDIVAVIGAGGLPIGTRSHERPPRFMPGPVVLLMATPNTTITGPAAETVILETLVPGGLIGPSGQIEVTLLGAMSASVAANRTIRVKLGGVALIAHAPVNTATGFRIQTFAAAAGEGNVRLSSTTHGSSIGPSSGPFVLNVPAIDHSTDQLLQITLQADSAPDTVTLVAARVVIWPSE